MPSATRVRLPSGGWWDLETRPRWKHVREWASSAEVDSEGPTSLPELVLVKLTLDWSFAEEVTLDSLASRSPADVAAAMDAVERTATPLLNGRPSKELAEELLEGLVTGRIPDDFTEAHILALTGWSYRDLLETPAEVVERVTIYLAVREARETGGALDVPEDQHE